MMKNCHSKPLIIGIDPGVKTGLAIWNREHKSMIIIYSSGILQVMKCVLNHKDQVLKVRMEDARKRKWFGKTDREVLQGAGSIKRDCQIWEEFFELHNISFELVAPKNNKTKLDAKLFSKLTGWVGRTNEHERDAAMLVYNL
jgi:hypothetical protein